MPLHLPKLDIRTFDQLVTEGQALISRYAPAWTDHNFHDPGITIIDLFAWLIEMDFYRLDRTTEASFRSFLRLVGVESRPAQVAETVLVFHLNKGKSAVSLPRGLQVANADAAIVFQIANGIHISSSRLTVVLTGGEDALVSRSAENQAAGKSYLPFGSRPRLGDALYLGFDQPLAEKPVELSLYVCAGLPEADRTTRERLIAEWKAIKASGQECPRGIEPDLPDWGQHYSARTVWEYYASSGEWTPLSTMSDETRGLTLSGPVRFIAPVKREHVAGGVKGKPYVGMYFIRCRLVTGGYECPPEIIRIAINAVQARHAADVGMEELKPSDGTAGQVFQLGHTPVVPGSTRVQVLVNGIEDSQWHEVLVWDRVGPHDRKYLLVPESAEIVFGNGRQGRVPQAGAKLRTTYQVGSDTVGNVGPETVTKPLAGAHNSALVPAWDTVLKNLVVEQPFAAVGGRSAEPLSEAKGRAANSVSDPPRAVTLADFEALALATPGVPVARANALADYNPAMPCLPALGCLTVVVVPRCLDPRPEPSPKMLQAVERYLNRRRTLTTELHVIGPSYTIVAVSARLHVAPGTDLRKLKELSRSKLDDFLNPLRGGPDESGWPVGRGVYRTEVMAMLNSIPGVTHVSDVQLRGEKEPAVLSGYVALVVPVPTTRGSRIVVSARLQVAGSTDVKELREQAQSMLERFFYSLPGCPDKCARSAQLDASRADLTTLLSALPGVIFVDEVSVDAEAGSEARCGNLSVCPHGLIAAGEHHITVGERGSCHE
jgi:hypothetical protein